MAFPPPSSQRISELLKELNEDSRTRFYKKWAALRSEKEYLALDITSISSWSELVQYVERGYNRDHEQLFQINLAMLFGEDSKLPAFFRAYPGSVKDVSTLLGLTSFIEKIKLEQMHFVMDKGFYSEKGIAPLLEQYQGKEAAYAESALFGEPAGGGQCRRNRFCGKALLYVSSNKRWMLQHTSEKRRN